MIWNNEEKSISVIIDENTYKATIGSNVYSINDENITLKTKTSLIDGTTFVPVTFINLFSSEYGSLETLNQYVPEDVAYIITKTVGDKMYTLKEEQMAYNEEYKKAFLETGGNLDEYIEPSEIGYELVAMTDNSISYKVYRFQALASSFTEETYYNFDRNTGELITLSQLLGEGYEENVKEEIIKTATLREANGEVDYFDGYEDTINIDETTSFYINSDGNVTIVLPKYSLAPGVYGSQEFVIE